MDIAYSIGTTTLSGKVVRRHKLKKRTQVPLVLRYSGPDCHLMQLGRNDHINKTWVD